MDSVIVVFILGALGLPGVTSAVTAALGWVRDNLGIRPVVAVYVVSVAVTGAVLATTGSALPAWTGDPVGYVGLWLAWATANAELARRLYEAFIEKVYPAQT